LLSTAFPTGGTMVLLMMSAWRSQVFGDTRALM
jgi:hypothetical protein